MKNFTLLLFCLIGFSCLSQDIRLFEQTWILHDLILDGQSYIPPINSEQNHVPADFIEPNEFYTGVCGGTGGAGTIIYNGTTEFSFSAGIYWLAGSCNLEENNVYSDLYQSFWNKPPFDPFQYEIIETGQDRTLIVTASNGDQAIYSNSYLSISEFNNQSLSIYPNPSTDILNIKFNHNISINRIIIYDFQGRQVSYNTKNLSQINVGDLKPGIYFISIENDENEILNKKFFKK
ncbi:MULTISPECIES: T9SS type A sorting domain-containing protein [Aequorivita]|uniref:T9SS type A sorting domain-containing protein n=1 Tax=Aequorivita iocasae TaxID=2803865 RepID=A0ABX7DR47_9FLAO|nr:MULTISPECIES: T9SS type A sorting domain-containing protein [Aequorivita]QQX75932.1 T9SS type A sorting domain-containing protein [Aequorivita iocasae]UCA55394.1 T9SS type A sorting domain-containing protein [Aequorivita sp. F7]